MIRLKFRREQPAHRDVGDRRQPPGAGCRRHIAERFAAVCRKRSTAIGENEFGCDVGMANSHLQRDEPAISVAEHDGLVSAGGIDHSLRHSIGDFGKACADRPGLAEAGQFRDDHPKRLRQPGNDGVETRPIRQQRMQQNKRLAVAELRRIDRAVGEKPIHCRLSFKFKVARLEMPMRQRCVWALLINQNSANSRLCHLT